MKKNISIITLILFTLGGILLGYFIKIPKCNKTDLQVPLVHPQEKPLATYITYAQAKELASNYEKFRKANLLDAYVQAQCAHIKNGSTEETKSVWFSYSELSGFLSNVITSNESVDPKDLGIRIYFGVYPDSAIVNPKHPYGNRMTVFFVPTKREPLTPNGIDTVATDIIGKEQSFLTFPPYDHGKLCPPDTCNGSAF